MSFARPNVNLELAVGGLLMVSGIVVSFIFPQRLISAALRLDGICCNYVMEPIVARLKAVEGVEIAEVRPAFDEIRLQWSARATVSHEEIWSAAHRGAVEPSSLSINGRVVKKKSSP